MNPITLSSLRSLMFLTLVLFVPITVISQGQDDHNQRIMAHQFVLSNESRLQDNSESLEKLYLLTKLAPAALIAGDTNRAKQFARDLQSLGDGINRKSHYENPDPTYATHISNIVLGLIALDEAKIPEAKEYLLAAGQLNERAYPTLATFGPDMLLAKKLIERGERKIVIQYLDACGKFWKMENGRLDKWKNVVNQGGIPRFGSNLLFVVNKWRQG